MDNHTPGPWKISETSWDIFGEDGFLVCDPGQGPHISKEWQDKTRGGDYEHWAQKPGVSFYDPSEERIEANARLIAAAPDLLEIIKKALDNGEYTVHGFTTYGNWELEARAAIAKARENSNG